VSGASSASATTGCPPSGPSDLSAGSTSASSIALVWHDNSNAESGIYVERCVGLNCMAFSRIATLSANIVGYTDSGLSPSTYYSYRVQAFNDAGSSNYSNTATALTTAIPSAPVDSFTVNAQSSWLTAGSASGGGRFPKGKIDTVYATAFSGFVFRDWTENGPTGPVAATTAVYSFPVTAARTLVANFDAVQLPKIDTFTVNIQVSRGDAGTVSGSGRFPKGARDTARAVANRGFVFRNWTDDNLNGPEASKSPVFDFTVDRARTLVANFDAVPPIAPNAVRVTVVSSNIADVIWTDRSADEDGFRVERSTGSNSGFDIIGRTAANATTFRDSTVVASTTYRYIVRSFGPGGASVTVDTATITTPPIQAAGISLTPDAARIVVDSSVQLSASALDPSGKVIPGKTITFGASSPLIASVSGTGLVRGVSPGTATITATVDGKSKTSSITVDAKVQPTLTLNPAGDSGAVGGKLTIQATIANQPPNSSLMWT